MIRTVTYRFPLRGQDVGGAKLRVENLALARARRNKNLYEVQVTPEGTDLVVAILVNGHDYWRANGIAQIEAETIARALRTKGTLESSATEPTMRNLTVEQGRVMSYEDRIQTRRRNQSDRLTAFRERMTQNTEA